MIGTQLQVAGVLSINTDTYAWANPYGGNWGTAANWADTAIGFAASTPPSGSNPITLTGGSGGNFTDIIGNGAAGQISVTGDVLLWGSVAAAGTLTLLAGTTPSELDLDGGASVTATGLSLAGGSVMEAADGSKFSTFGTATLTDGFVLATNGSTIQLATLVANGLSGAYGMNYGTIAVDDGASIEIGTTGGVALGAITVDSLRTAAVSGRIDGNLVLNGTLAVQGGGSLVIDSGDPFGSASTITGTGALTIGENSVVTLGVADSAATRFSGPDGTLVANVLPTGTISGFAAGDTIELTGLATGLSYSQTSNNLGTLTLSKGGHTVGALALAGNYTGGLFHIQLNAAGIAFITEQTVGTAPAQPSVITGTAGSDVLIATANSQTITGGGGNDILGGGAFTGIDFKDTSADLNGSTITAFVSSDTIDLTDMRSGYTQLTYTPAIYSPSAPPVPATLLANDGTHVATMTLSQIGTLPIGSWSVISDGATGALVKYTTVNTDAYGFAPPTGDLYSVASNWRDSTTSATATVVPGYGNSVSLTGGATFVDVGGNGIAGSLITNADLLLLGTVTVGGGVVGVSGALTQSGTLALDNRANLALTGSASVAGLVEAGDGSKLTAAGGASFAGNAAWLLAIGGSTMQFGSIIAGSSPGGITVDGNSSIEFGTAGGAKTGAITIDSGLTASFGGSIEGNVVVNGTLQASGQLLAIAPLGSGTCAVTGTGTLEIDSAGTLALSGSDTAAILFSATGGTLALGTIVPSGTIAGFAKGDVISLGRSVTSLIYTATGLLSSTLTLMNGTTAIGSLSLAGAYMAQQFQLLPGSAGATSSITYAATPSTAVGNQVSSGTDGYSWINTGGGVWSNAANWFDTTTGRTAVTAPGSADAVVIQDNPGAATSQIISGTGSATSLQVYGAGTTDFTGAVSIAGLFYIANSAGGGVTLAGGARLAAGALSVYSSLGISGGSTLTVTGALGGTEVVGAMSVIGGSSVRTVTNLDVGGGVLSVDATSTLEEGATGGTAAGTLTIDSGMTGTAEENGIIAAKMVLNGTLITDYATIEGFGGTEGSVTGSGTLQIGSVVQPGNLILHAADSAALRFVQSGDKLEVQGVLPTGQISGFSVGDTIQLDQTVTGASYLATSGTQGTLTLTNGAATVGTLTLIGNYASSRFQVDVAAATGFGTVSLLPVTSSAGSAAVNGGADAYSWTGASGGSWSTAANWTDTTAGIIASFQPGIGNAVTLGGTVAIGGNGSAGRLTTSGYALLTGQIAVNGTVATTSGVLALGGGGKLTASAAIITGELEAGGASTVTVSNTGSLASGTLLALNGSSIQLGSLLGTGSGNVIAVDANSMVKVGSAPSAAGALSVGTGCTAALSGSIYGNVVAIGTLAAAGTLMIDMTGAAESDPYATGLTISGRGTLAITQGGTLGLGVVDSTAIQFFGPNATLALAAIPSATISGFCAGDQIVLDQTVTGLSFTQTSGSQGALVLTNGATMVGTLQLAGSYTGSMFHLDASPNGATAAITLQTLGLAGAQPALIQGTMLTETLTATQNGQTLTGGGGSDTLNAAGFTAIDFKDTTANMNNATLQNFAKSDILDFTDLSLGSASLKYINGIVSVTDGVHAASVHLAFATTPSTGGFTLSSDGAAGTKIMWSGG